ncbi:Acryloyl-CoA reductase (NADH) [Marinomonas aquimarina]|uniref:3-methylmercaptopropionyl-CoA dehydrogenase n=1 Tax=Marinomonas aquimarina TaxID=295068 RepID=A0A1A8TSJ7_9GAMM|nr:acyl-CoA dehydrogenase [Marinomonas aquimarina]SBS35978.1 Acryloyl-CoA reductase (NADH) [Marinomonas aquimarina]
MSGYRYPAKDIQFCLEHIADIARLEPHFPNYGADLVEPILSEAAKFSEQCVAPTNRLGDKTPPKMVARCVQETPDFKHVYELLQEAAWTTLAAPEEFGGQGLPRALEVAFNEGIQSANLSFSLCPLLTQGAVDAIETHASQALKEAYLPNMVSGKWTGTMNLTEPAAGTDLAAIKTKAVPDGDQYRLYGQKIFITWGDHLMSENIIHLVLARLPDAPEGVKGISLFLVPKYLLDENGHAGRRNDVFPLSLEHKMGIHGSPTCVMQYGETEGAIGYLVGEENKGLAAMFTMMNNARQSVGLQGLAVAEAAYQMALDYAHERKQGSVKGSKEKAVIAEHGDVKRMLWQMASTLAAMRALMYTASVENDLSNTDAKHMTRTELYTPIVKGWLTEMAQEITSLAVQVHGGMGYIEETGVAQLLRDARILPIYEGTNGVQALDLVGRKLAADQGMAMSALIDEMQTDAASFTQHIDLVVSLKSQIRLLSDAKQAMLDGDVESSEAAYDFMMLSGYVIGGWLLLKGAQSDQADQAWLAKANFYFDHIAVRSDALFASVKRFSKDQAIPSTELLK